MTQEDIEALKAKHHALLALCKAGAKGTVPVPPEKLLAADDERRFCAVCAANKPAIADLLKLYGLQDWFQEHAPGPPAQGEDAAQEYLARCEAIMRTEAALVPVERLREMARDAVQSCAAHFSGKLVHPTAQGAFLMAPCRPTAQPHVSSRSLRQAGIALALDQSKLDNTGVYQRVVRLLGPAIGTAPSDGNDEAQEPGAEIARQHADALREGAIEGIEAAARRIPGHVDRRLRQVLLPVPDGYLAVTPLPAGGMAALWHACAAFESGREAERLASLDDTENANPPAPGRKRRGKSGFTAQNKAPQISARPIFSTVELPFGGAIVRNTSLFPASVIQRQMVFAVPQPSQHLRAVWRFVFRPWTPWISDVKQVNQQIAALQVEGRAFSDSTSVAAVLVQSKGALGTLARKCHAQAVNFAQDLAQTPYVEDGKEIDIDADLLRRKRKDAPSDLDLAIVNRSFDARYRAALAMCILDQMRSRLIRMNEPTQIDYQNVRDLVRSALELALENT